MKTKSPLLTQIALTGALALYAGMASAADYSATLSSLSPLGHWQLNEPSVASFASGTATNIGTAGSVANGTYYFTPTLQAVGTLGLGQDPAASFNGNSQYGEVPFSPALNPSGTLTVEFWAYLTNASAGAKSGVVSRYIAGSVQRGYLFFVNNGNTKWQFRVYNGAAGVTVTDVNGPNIDPNTWYHVVGVYDGTQAHIYVNGIENSPAVAGIYAANTNAPLRLGAGTTETAPSLYFPGTLDEVAIYNTVLSPSQIAAHYDAATTNAAGYAAQILALNPAGYYRLDEAVLPPAPTAANIGTLGTAQNASYTPGSAPGATGPRNPQFAGFTPTNLAITISGNTGRGQLIAPAMSTVTSADHATFTCWLKRNGLQSNFPGLVFTRPTATGLGLDNNLRLSYTWNDAANTYNFNSGLLTPDGVWIFAALVVTPTNAILYSGGTNGLISATNNVTHAAHDFSTAPLYLGFDNGNSFSGGIDEAAFFDTALDPLTISNLFYSATPAVPLVGRAPADPLYEGMTVTFTAYGVASGPINYQWRKNGSNLAGRTTSVLALTNVTTSSSGNYDVVASYGANSVTSSVSAITIAQGPPVVFTQPGSASRFAGGLAGFNVLAGGSVPLTYQWQKNSNNVAGATTSALNLTNVTLASAGAYRVMLVNPYGTNFSTNAILTVLPVTNYAATIMSGPPLAYWRMSEASGLATFDYAGGHNGTLNGPVTYSVPGPQPPTFAGLETTNVAFGFNGTSTYVLALPELGITTDAATMTAFVRRDGTQVDTAHILCHRSGGNTVALHVDATGSILRYTWADAAGTYSWNSGLTLPDGQWTFVALVVEPTRAIMYMDDGTGLQSAIHSFNHALVTFNTSFQIGRDSRGDRYWNGPIDEVAFYGYALSADEINNLRLMAVSGPTAPAIVTEPTSQSVFAGQSAAFTVGAIGASPLSYQWKRNGVNVSGATGKTLTLAGVYYTAAGSYAVAIANSLGSTNSLAATLSVAAPPTFANLTNSLVLHLKFNDNPDDSSGHGNNGIIVGTTNYVPGKLGSALQYNTDTDTATYNYVTLGTPPDLQFGATTNFSVAYWVKFTGLPGDLPFLGSGANSWGSFGLTFAPSYAAGGWSYWLGGDTGGAGLYGPANTINNGAWHSLVHTFDRTGLGVTYLDGVQVDSRPIASIGNVDSGLTFNIGQDPTGTYGESATADIDDVGIWQRALTATEAQSIFLVGNSYGRSFDTYGPVKLTLISSGGSLELIWEAGVLESADAVTGPWLPVIGANAPYYQVTPTAAKKFYRVRL